MAPLLWQCDATAAVCAHHFSGVVSPSRGCGSLGAGRCGRAIVAVAVAVVAVAVVAVVVVVVADSGSFVFVVGAWRVCLCYVVL